MLWNLGWFNWHGVARSFLYPVLVSWKGKQNQNSIHIIHLSFDSQIDLQFGNTWMVWDMLQPKTHVGPRGRSCHAFETYSLLNPPPPFQVPRFFQPLPITPGRANIFKYMKLLEKHTMLILGGTHWYIYICIYIYFFKLVLSCKLFCPTTTWLKSGQMGRQPVSSQLETFVTQ